MSSTIEPEGDGQQFVSDDELKGLLERWISPEPSKSLDQRVANSYYTEMGNVVNAAAESIRFPQSQKEVVTMKFCSTCKEEFADKFSFCPVDGTPLSAPVVEPEVVKAATVREPVRPSTHILAAAGSAALASRGEYHLTMIDDAGLVGRLAKEVTDVAHQYQLTWPEFKRDPFGFTKRSLVGYGQMISKFFANRNVVIAMIVAVLAIVGVVLIAALLDRSQAAGSRAGLIGFGVVAGAILISIFATWLRKNQGAAIMGAPENDANNAVFGVIAAFSVLFLLVGAGVFLNFWQQKKAEQQQVNDELVLNQLIDIPAEQPTPDKGTAGMAKGNGGGSKPKQEKAGGGGGGGRQEQTPASAGKPPQADLKIPPVVAPDPHPPTIKNPVLPVAAQLDADKALFPPDARVLPYGLKTGSTVPSSGPGTGNGMGTGTGGGMGPGEGNGYGPGRGGNTGGGDRNEGGGGPGGGGGGFDPNKIYSGKDVSSKARVLSKPEPQYTEEARKNQVTGTVVLRAVFTSGGQVSNIRAVSGLPFGLTERAIAAARQIKFAPATKDGHPVSMYIQLEYNFNLY